MSSTPLTVEALRVTEGGHAYVLSRALSIDEVATALEVFERYEAALQEVVPSVLWDYGGTETSRYVEVEGLTLSARPRVERVISEMITDVAPGHDDAVHASFNALPLDLPKLCGPFVRFYLSLPIRRRVPLQPVT